MKSRNRNQHGRAVFLFSILLAAASSFSPVPIISARPRQDAVPAVLAAASSSPTNNEFSRTVQPDRVLMRRQQSSDYTLSISAQPVECQKLATRFGLPDIAHLSADLSLRPERIGGRIGGSGGSGGVVVEGTCQATVTQTCVRTNQDFAVQLEFPMYAIVRPVLPMSALIENDNDGKTKKKEYRRTEPRSGKKTSYRPQDLKTTLDEMDVVELQKRLQTEVEEQDDNLMEDESIYVLDGELDVGELVSQLLCLELDPYPKKPGTEPVQRSISG